MSDDKKTADRTRSPQPKVVYSTTEGRQKFPDILQTSFGEKAVIGFDRYGRAIGAVVPMEAVRILAGLKVDPDISDRIHRTANELLRNMPSEAQRLDENSAGNLSDDLKEIEEARSATRGSSPRSSTSRVRRSG